MMDVEAEAETYVAADFREVNEAFVERLLEVAPVTDRHLDIWGRLDFPGDHSP